MLEIKKNHSIKSLNTFGIDVLACYFVEIKTVNELKEILNHPSYKALPKLFLGGGSNILLLKDFEGIVIKINIKCRELVDKNTENVILKAGAGENWHEFVLYTIDNDWSGIENLSLIPGTVGAAPIQNIGAYGVELKDVFESLEALNLETLEIEKFDKNQCQFNYRDSFFKNNGKNKYVILFVCFKLNIAPILKTNYGAINETLLEMGVFNPSIKDISDAVIRIRKSKLPDPEVIGNAGSFFKNPEIPVKLFNELIVKFPDIPSYPVGANLIKVPAGWLIEKAGWKGYKNNNVGVHDKQALVLVNFGNGRGEEIKILAEKIQASVKEIFGINISPEVNFI
jgi:UDP-N-acetylmuramate dehydrogenase